VTGLPSLSPRLRLEQAPDREPAISHPRFRLPGKFALATKSVAVVWRDCCLHLSIICSIIYRDR
jgi:hypothetical protein